jgi:hypothetical protein
MLTALLCLLAAAPAQRQGGLAPEIGPTPIPFYTGNLSVDSFMYYFGTRKEPPAPQVTAESIAQLRRISCFAVCDYLSWPLVEKEPGRWDFSLYLDNAARLRAAGIEYNVFAWLHFPPKWYRDDPDFVPYRCLEHGLPVEQMSLWSPATRRVFREFYAHLAQAMGRDISFLRLGMPSEYGEIGYPVGMTNWLVPQEHVHPGFWCGDPYARRAFREFAMARYKTVRALNAAWGTAFGSANDIDFPSVAPDAVARLRAPEQAPARIRWLDFIDWYNQSWTDFLVWAAGVVKQSFPGFGVPPSDHDLRPRKEIIASLGYGAEAPATGNDQSRHIKAMRAAGLSAQTPGDIGYFATRRVSTACALYGVPYYTEPPGDVNRDREVQRIWMDASNGAQVFFDYPQNLDGARDLFAEYKEHLTGRRSITDLALLLPTTTLFLHPEWGWPPYLHGFSDVVRDVADFEVVDERMIADGALQRLGIRVVALADAEYLQAATLRSLTEWVRAGGVLAALQTAPVRTIDGSDTAWAKLAPRQIVGDTTTDLADVWRRCSRRVGKGAVVVLPGGPERIREQAAIVGRLYSDRASVLRGAKNAWRIDPDFDGVRASRLADRILYYNAGDQAVTKRVTLRAEDATAWGVAPERLSFNLQIAAHRIAVVRLGAPPVVRGPRRAGRPPTGD